MKLGFNKKGTLDDEQKNFMEIALNRKERPDINERSDTDAADIVTETALRINAILQLNLQLKESVMTLKRLATDTSDYPDVVITAINRIDDQPFLLELLDRKKTVKDGQGNITKKNFINNSDVRKAAEERLTVLKAPVKEVA